MCWENKYVLVRSYKDKTVVGNLGHTAVETKVQVPQLNFNPSRFLPTGGRRAVIPPPQSPFIDSQPDQDRIISLLPLTQARQGIYFPLFVFHWLPEHWPNCWGTHLNILLIFWYTSSPSSSSSYFSSVWAKEPRRSGTEYDCVHKAEWFQSFQAINWASSSSQVLSWERAREREREGGVTELKRSKIALMYHSCGSERTGVFLCV